MLTPEQMLSGYAAGVFPMAPSRGSAELYWMNPQRRGIIPLDGFHISRSLARRIRRGGYEVRCDTAFGAVVAACADRPDTWINAELTQVYDALFAAGHAHALEIWQDGYLTGGVFGLTLGGAFFAESMFSRRTDASKLALAHLLAKLTEDGFVLFDTQYLTDHLASLGGIEISRGAYQSRLEAALTTPARFRPDRPAPSGQDVLAQRSTQTS